jgi:hypothetical protein
MHLVHSVTPFLALVASSQAFIPPSRGLLLTTLQQQSTSSDTAVNSLDGLTVPALKNILRSRGLPVSGRKAELLERLRGTDTESGISESNLQAEPTVTNTRSASAR